jgi:hypothetical protein
MFLGGDQHVRSLSLYLAAYGQSRADLGFERMAIDDEDFLRAFERWLIETHNLDAGNRTWPGLIEMLDDGPTNVRTFFEELEKFLSTMGRSLERMEPWPFASSLRPERDWPIERDALSEVERLLRQGPSTIERLLDEAPRPLSNGPIYFHGLAEASGSRACEAFEREPREPGLAWARVAVRIYEVLATETRDLGFELSAMHLRVTAIAALGELAEDAVRDPARITDWFKASLVYSIESALASSRQTLDELRRLRDIKNRLGVIARLASVTTLDAEAQRWLSIRDQLP